VILQHDDLLLATSEFGFHDRAHINFLTVRQSARRGVKPDDERARVEWAERI
jgi:hypothetical protein